MPHATHSEEEDPPSEETMRPQFPVQEHIRQPRSVRASRRSRAANGNGSDARVSRNGSNGHRAPDTGTLVNPSRRMNAGRSSISDQQDNSLRDSHGSRQQADVQRDTSYSGANNASAWGTYATTDGQYQSGTSSNNRNITRSAARHQANTDLPAETVSEEQAGWLEDPDNWVNGRYDGPQFPGADVLEADYVDNRDRSQNAFDAHGYRFSGQQE